MGKLAIVPIPPQRPEPDISFRSYDRITPGEYTGFCRSVKVYFDSHWRRWVWTPAQERTIIAGGRGIGPLPVKELPLIRRVLAAAS